MLACHRACERASERVWQWRNLLPTPCPFVLPRSWETQLAINYSQLALWSSLLKVLLISHWFACIWGIQVALAERKVGTWVDSFEYCTPVSDFPPGAVVRGLPVSAYAPDDCVPDDPWALYSAAIYWAVMTITSIGYGDIHATNRNVSEQVLNTLLMLTGAMLWGHVIGTFCGIVATMNPHGECRVVGIELAPLCTIPLAQSHWHNPVGTIPFARGLTFPAPIPLVRMSTSLRHRVQPPDGRPQPVPLAAQSAAGAAPPAP
jgi:hypothetical protein